MIITRGISLTNFLVASSALGFQIFVLYPWHKQLDDDFEKLKHEHIRVLRTIERFHAMPKESTIARLAAGKETILKLLECVTPLLYNGAIREGCIEVLELVFSEAFDSF
ncbi:hypothetical protein H072_7355 [Dactylellina haptotyla CBS 200.50]|uniref:Uncharacterized protein n=1 Tax=Dactylellina haptotyla (strain CBS 200.50) TaxID=1284197 RepID=S8ACS5_DACHA|nr:hypothetical protein H072_7355 [Dactylellina haptotyla CBS 200.50]